MGWPGCSLPGEVVLLHETVSMCCTLCDNMGRESTDDRIEGPRINKVLSVQSGVFRIKLYHEPVSAHRDGAGRRRRLPPVAVST